jgi:hypothetical protein
MSHLLITETPSWLRDYPNRHLSSELADRFDGVLIDDADDDEGRHMAVNMFVSLYHLLEGTGWYEHTGDWDFHLGVRLEDGREESHFGDGAMIDLALEDGTTPDHEGYSGDETRHYLRIEAPPFLDEQNYVEVIPHPFDEYITDRSEDDGYFVWLIPVRQIRKLTFGYCT